MSEKFRPIVHWMIGFVCVIASVAISNSDVAGMSPVTRFISSPAQDGATQQPDQAQVIAQIAANAQNSEDYSIAAKQWEKLLSQFPQSPLAGKAHYNAGVCYVQLGKFQKAIDQLTQSLPRLEADQAQQLPQAYLYLGFSQYKLGQRLISQNDESTKKDATMWLTTSTQTFAKLIDKFPNFEDVDQACFFQGGAFEDLRRLEDAEKSYAKMLTCPKQTFKFDGLFAIANVNEQLGRYTQALDYYEKFQTAAKDAGGSPLTDEVNFHIAKTLMGLAVADKNLGDEKAALESYQRAGKLFEQLANQDKTGKSAEFLAMADESQFQQAYCLTQEGDFETAAKVYAEVAARPDSKFRVRSLVNAGRSYALAGNIDAAIATLSTATEFESPIAIEAAAALSHLYLENKDNENAYATANQWIKKGMESPLLPNLMMDRADAAFLMTDRRGEAAKLFLEIVDKFPDHRLTPSALYNAAFAFLATKDTENAIATANRFEQKHADSEFLPDVLEVKGDALLRDEQGAGAEQVFEKLSLDYPNHEKATRWLMQTALAKFLQKKYQPTIDLLQPSYEKLTAGDRAEALHWIGSSQFHLDQFAPAAQSLQKSIDAGPWRRGDETRLVLARALLAAKQTAAATTALNSLFEEFPNSPLVGDAHYYLGESAYDAGEYDSAFKEFQTVIDQHANSRLVPFSLYNAAWSKQKLEQFDAAEKLFSKLIADFPDHELSQTAKIGRGASRRKTGDTENSITDLKEFLADQPAGQTRLNALYELGLAQIEQQEWAGAIKTFETLISEDTDSPRADRYHYELAWAHQSQSSGQGTEGMSAEALQHFASIANEFPESTLAPEANFHIGTTAYHKNDLAKAIAAYQKCVDAEGADSVREKAFYKLGWSFYKQKKFEDSLKQFQRQVELFPSGELYADGTFMVAESQFRLRQHEQALAAYLVAKPAVDAADNIDPKIKFLTMLHGAQSANKTRKFDEALALAEPLIAADSDNAYKNDAWMEIGVAREGLKQDVEALQAWRNATRDLGKTGARAGCLIGDLYFRQKKFDDAINEYKEVYYKYVGDDVPAGIKPWLAYALYETARCNHVQVKQASPEKRQELIDEAVKNFQTLIKNFPDDRLAPEARKQLQRLEKTTADSSM